MSLVEAERWLGMKPSSRGRSLRSILLSIESKEGHRIMVRSRGQGRGMRYRVTRSALRRYCKHLVPSKVDELRERFAQFLAGVDEKIESKVAEHLAEFVEPQLDDLWQRDETLSDAVRQLSVRVKRVEQQLA